jgi:DNA adenine methylase
MARRPLRKSGYQLPLLEADRLSGVINVASVPQRSVFRYPGGKTWFVPYIRQWLRSLPERPVSFIEPFAGGGIVGLTVAFEALAEQVILVELDAQVAAVWHTILSDDANWLAERIVRFDLSPANVEAVLSTAPASCREQAFQVILKNRVNRSGILAPGAGRIRSGEKGKGIASRWYPQTLKQRILEIAALRECIRFIEGDGVAFVRQQSASRDVAYFIDPPYTAGGKRAGNRLYAHSEIDHEALFEVVRNLAGSFLMTYDNIEDVRALARKYGFDAREIAMKNTHHTRMTELLIGRDLGWLPDSA